MFKEEREHMEHENQGRQDQARGQESSPSTSTITTTASMVDPERVAETSINFGRENYSILKSNAGDTEIHVMQRFPTFAINYSDQNHEVLKFYDLIIVDPGTVTRKEVAAWQQLGIKVIGYVSFGEEDGIQSDPWNDESPIMPHVDDGKGPGGYASYYNKGGNCFSEQSQCTHDRLIKDNIKACSKNNSHYFTGVGCCTKACKNDYRTGYAEQSEGGKCNGGYTAANYWQRDGSAACSNKKCPKYAPYHGKCPQYKQHEGWGQDLSYTTPDYPDQNEIWGSSYVNPLAPRWREKIKTEYLGQRVFGLPKEITETVTLSTYTNAKGSINYVFRTSGWPIDKDEPVKIATLNGYEYKQDDFDFDNTTGAFNMEAKAGAAAGHPVGSGVQLQVTYSIVGMGADGVFIDTIDTVDVYPSDAFQGAMADLINDAKSDFPTKMFIANRGFAILPDFVASCSHVMFETFISEYDWDNGTYYRLVDPEVNEYNEEIKELLRDLRKEHQFDVLALNYCADDVSGNELREIIAQECYAEGYWSWSSSIMLDNPLLPYNVVSPAWKDKVDPDNPFSQSFPAVIIYCLVRYQDSLPIWPDKTECSRVWCRVNEIERDDWYELMWYPISG